MSGRWLESVLKASGGVWKVFGMCLEGLWKVGTGNVRSGIGQAVLWILFEVFLEGVWKESERCLKGVWKSSGRYLEGIDLGQVKWDRSSQDRQIWDRSSQDWSSQNRSSLALDELKGQCKIHSVDQAELSQVG